MLVSAKIRTPKLAVYDYRCTSRPEDAPFKEVHGEYSLSFVRRGSFGYRSRGRHFDLVAGSLLIAYPGDEYMCTHEHHCRGDECLSFKLAPEVVEEIDAHRDIWRIGGIPPLPELMILGELAQAVADRRSDVSFEEVTYGLVARFVALAKGVRSANRKPRSQDSRRVVDVARWIEANSHEAIDLDAAAKTAGMSPYHLLRTFARVLGVTPHQYLIRSRLRHAARLLTDEGSTVTQIAGAVGFADLSNFIRTFGRAAGMSPVEFRRRVKREEPQKTQKRTER